MHQGTGKVNLWASEGETSYQESWNDVPCACISPCLSFLFKASEFLFLKG